MKRKFTILFLLLIAINSAVFAEYCYLKDEDSGSWINGKQLGYYIEQSCQITEISAKANKTIITEYGEEIDITISGKFRHYVVLMNRGLFDYCAALGSFDIKYYINGKLEGSETLKITPNTKDPNNVSNVELNTYYESFSKTITIKTSTTKTENLIENIYVTVQPTNSSPSQSIIDGSHYEKGYYVFDQSQRECPLVGFFKQWPSDKKNIAYQFIPNEQQHIVITDNNTNPYKTLKGNTYNLVYGDENAVLKVSLPKENVSASMNNLPAKSAMVVGVNRNPFASSISFCSNTTGSGCGEYDYIEYRRSSVDLLKNELAKHSQLTNKARFKGLMLQSEYDALTGKTTIKKPSIVTLNSSESSNIWYTKTFLLSDMQYAVSRNSQASSITNSGTLLNVAHKLCYFDYTAKDGFMELGYANVSTTAGETLIKRLATYNDAQNIPSANTLKFYVVPKAVFNSIAEDQLATQYVCMPKSTASNEKELIILYDNTIKSEDGTIDANIYEPNYFWEFSYNKTSWNKLTESNKINPSFDIDKGDLYVNADILSNNSVVYFRQ